MATVNKRGAGITVEPDIRTLAKALRDSPDRLDLTMRKRFRDIATGFRDQARAAAQGQHPHAAHPRQRSGAMHWSRLVNSIISGSQNDGPYVTFGSDSVPWAVGYEFGSHVHRQFPDWRGTKGNAGYFFFPTFRRMGPDIAQAIQAVVDETLAIAFPD